MSSPPSVRHFAIIGAILLGLLALTLGVAYLNLGPLNTPVALAIALTKALLILFYFMELRAAAGLMRLFAAAGFFWLGIMLTLALSDFLTR